MLILALDTTTRAGSVAVSDDDRMLALVLGDPTRTHGERLPAEIARALAEAGAAPRDLNLLVVASGPGAFTGLRIGLAAIQGIALAIGLPVVGVSALEALALAAEPALNEREVDALLVWMDAQRGEVFAGHYEPAVTPGQRWVPAGDAVVAPPADQLASLASPAPARVAFTGDGAVKYRDTITAWSQTATIVEPPAALAPALTSIGRRLAAAGHAGPPHALQPLYVRRPDAEIERLRRTTP